MFLLILTAISSCDAVDIVDVEGLLATGMKLASKHIHENEKPRT